MYEGYGPGGVAILIDAATDNKNRTVAEVRHILSKGGGSMGASGCVAWMFDKKGVLSFPKDAYSDEQLLEIGLEAGAEDIVDEDDTWQVQCAVEDFSAVRDAFAAAGIEPAESEITMIPQNTVPVDRETGLKLLRLYDALDDNDDVQNVYANFDLPEDLLAEMEE
jgi:YebC/PmpR family DNA-binding regulatory protein